MIKGKAKIELTNANGTKEVIEHENMITNAVSDLCYSQRGDMATILKMTNNNDSYAQALFGGLLLFDDTLNTDASDYTIPSCKITGYASQDAYAGLDVARGSFNASEGGIQEDGSYKFVWDFSTSQANGTIKSLALCPNVMGQIGATDTQISRESKNFYITRDQTAPFNTNGYMILDGDTTDGISNYYYNIVAIIDDIAYAIDTSNIEYDSSLATRYFASNGNILKLHKFKLGANNISLSDKVGMARYLGSVDIQLPTEFIENVNTSIDSTSYPITCYFNSYDKELLVFPCRFKADVEPNGTIKYVSIDMTTFAITTYTYTNTTPGTIRGKSDGPTSILHGGYSRYVFFVCKDYIFTMARIDNNENDNRIYITKRSDNTSVKEVKRGNGNSLQWYNGYILSNCFESRNIFCFLAKNNNNNRSNYFIIDKKNALCKFTNSNGFIDNNNVNFGNEALSIKTGQKLTYVPTVNPFILTTKNNLDSPVTKTSSQTMKITYTLSEQTEGA